MGAVSFSSPSAMAAPRILTGTDPMKLLWAGHPRTEVRGEYDRIVWPSHTGAGPGGGALSMKRCAPPVLFAGPNFGSHVELGRRVHSASDLTVCRIRFC